MLKNLTPIVRGQCNMCGFSRNLWVNEAMQQECLPCSHQDRGCPGSMEIVYRGPKGMMPSHLENVRCACERGVSSRSLQGGSSSSSSAACSGMAKQLTEMGFSQQQAQAAAAQYNSVEEALDALTGEGGGSCTPCQAGTCGASAPTCAQSTPVPHEVGECSICVEELRLSDAAMRCSGSGGRQHYFHAKCLNSWVQQCRQQGLQPTCPECRGPVQVQRRVLQDFLDGKGQSLDSEERQAWRTLQEGSEDSNEFGWANIRPNVWKAAAGVAIVAGIGMAIVAGMAMLNEHNKNNNSSGSSGSRNGRDRRR